SPILDEVWRYSPDVSTSVAEVMRGDGTLYPNPTADRLYFDTTGRGSYMILNSTGSVVKTGGVRGPIDVAELERGVYLLVLDGSGGRNSARFVVDR
ncbi:MAG TPA: T9SS type A sorting domain-containing protein, partial [Flavobacteriales bacterium]|nr:T9SS type A sorting domain-containing protein [Flavobacteriales bacterium]